MHEAESGKVVHIARRGKAVAVLVSERAYQRLTEKAPDLAQALDQFRATHDLAELELHQTFVKVRSRSRARKFKW